MEFGIIGLPVIRFYALALGHDPPCREIRAVLFGVAAGLTLDEFALWLNLEDVYWAPKGRQSIDAVIVASVLGGMLLLGARVWIDLGRQVEELVAAAGIAAALVAVANLLKGKLAVAMLSFVFIPVGIAGALRLARPGSPWARLYDDDKRRRARERFPEPWLPARVARSAAARRQVAS